MSMNDSAQVNQVYLIFNRPQFLVDSSDLITFITVYPLLRLFMILLTDGESESVSRWDWPIGLFIGIGLFIFMVTAYKIYGIMHINPASIIKKE